MTICNFYFVTTNNNNNGDIFRGSASWLACVEIPHMLAIS